MLTARFVIVDDVTFTQEFLLSTITHALGLPCLGRYASVKTAIAGIRETKPDLVMLDMNLYDEYGIQVMEVIRPELPAIKWIICTALEGEMQMRRAMASGAEGIVLKSENSDDLITAIESVLDGLAYKSAKIDALIGRRTTASSLSEREKEILKYVANAFNPPEIASMVGSSAKTVQNQITEIKRKARKNTYEKLMRWSRAKGFGLNH